VSPGLRHETHVWLVLVWVLVLVLWLVLVRVLVLHHEVAGLRRWAHGVAP